jgi:hypothetical protein
MFGGICKEIHIAINFRSLEKMIWVRGMWHLLNNSNFSLSIFTRTDEVIRITVFFWITQGKCQAWVMAMKCTIPIMFSTIGGHISTMVNRTISHYCLCLPPRVHDLYGLATLDPNIYHMGRTIMKLFQELGYVLFMLPTELGHVLFVLPTTTRKQCNKLTKEALLEPNNDGPHVGTGSCQGIIWFTNISWWSMEKKRSKGNFIVSIDELSLGT